MTLLPDGKILAAGHTYGYQFAVARVNTNGTLDTTFGPDHSGLVTTWFSGSSGAQCVGVSSDGHIVLAGGVNDNFAIARYNADGSTDTNFGPDHDGRVTTDLGAWDSINDITVLPDGSFVVAGQGAASWSVAKYTSIGQLDTSFGDGGVVHPFGWGQNFAHAVDSSWDPVNHKILVAGDVWGWVTVARLNADGSADTSWGAGGYISTGLTAGNDDPVRLRATADSLIVSGSDRDLDTGIGHLTVEKFHFDGRPDLNFGLDGRLATGLDINDWARGGMDLTPTGEVVLTGNNWAAGAWVARFNPRGDLNVQDPPPAVGDLVTNVTGPHTIELSWTNVGMAVAPLTLTRRQVDSSTEEPIANLMAGTTNYTDTSPAANTSYVYSLTPAGGATITSSAVTTMLETPGAPSISRNGETLEVSVAPVDGATGYTLETSNDSYNWYTASYSSSSPNFSGLPIPSEGMVLYVRVVALNGMYAGSLPSDASNYITPPQPPSLSAWAQSAHDVEISVGYYGNTVEIERSTNGGSFAYLTSLVSGNTTYTDNTTLANTAYGYRARQIGWQGVASDYAYSEELTTPDGIPGAPQASWHKISSTEIGLTWDGDGDAALVHIVRTDPATGSTQEFSASATNGAFNDSGLTAAKQYSYSLNFVSLGGTAGPSASLDAYTAPSAPVNLSAAWNVDNSVSLTWSYPEMGYNGPYRIVQSPHGLNQWSEVAVVSAETSYSVSSLDASDGGGEDYAIIAMGTASGMPDSDRSDTATVYASLSPPNGIVASLTPGALQVDLAWNDPSTQAAGFIVERSSDGGTDFQNLGYVTGTTFSDSSIDLATTYVYRIRATAYSNGDSGPIPDSAIATSNSVTVPTLLDLTPAVPGPVFAFPNAEGSISVGWMDNSLNEQQFIVDRTTTPDVSNSWLTVGVAAANTTTFTDPPTSLSVGTRFYYRVRAANGSFVSDPSEITSEVSFGPTTIQLIPGAAVDEGTNGQVTVNISGTHGLDSLNLNWGDGTELSPTDSSGGTFEHLYLQDGVFAVSAIATDAVGQTVYGSPVSITVHNVDPTDDFSVPSDAVEGEPQTFEAYPDDVQSDLDKMGYHWSVTKDGDAVDLGDSPTDAKTFTFTPKDNGQYEVTLDLDDGDGGTATQTQQVDVANAKRTVYIDAESPTLPTWTPVSEGEEVPEYKIQLSASGDPNDEPVTRYEVDWGDGSNKSTVTANEDGTPVETTYPGNGGRYPQGLKNYTITAKAYDDDVDAEDADGPGPSEGKKLVQVAYYNNFEAGVQGFSGGVQEKHRDMPTDDSPPPSADHMLAETAGSAALSLSDLPKHTTLHGSFNLLVLNSWEKENSDPDHDGTPDGFTIKVGGKTVPIHVTGVGTFDVFHPNTNGSSAKIDDLPASSSGSGSDSGSASSSDSSSASNSDSGSGTDSGWVSGGTDWGTWTNSGSATDSGTNSGSGGAGDAAYEISFEFLHSDDSVEIDFNGVDLENEEAFSVDDVEITAGNELNIQIGDTPEPVAVASSDGTDDGTFIESTQDEENPVFTPMTLAYPDWLADGSTLTLEISGGEEDISVWKSASTENADDELLGDSKTTVTFILGSDSVYSLLYLKAKTVVQEFQSMFSLTANGTELYTNGSNDLVADHSQDISGCSKAASSIRTPLVRLDANQDGSISFDDSDQEKSDSTSSEKPFQFWLNNNHDISDDEKGVDANGLQQHDTEVDDHKADSRDDRITTRKDLDDFVHVRFSPENAAGIKDYEFSLHTNSVLAQPEIRIFPFTDGVGGGDPDFHYDQVAADKIVSYYTEHDHTNRSRGQLLIANGGIKYISADATKLGFMFEAVQPGMAKLDVKGIGFDGREVSSGTIYLELSSISRMYEVWNVGSTAETNNWGDLRKSSTSPLPTTVTAGVNLTQGSVGGSYQSGNPFYIKKTNDDQDYILFVHGWRMKPWERQQYAKITYKRLFWQGYRGRFGMLSWPTDWVNTDRLDKVGGDTQNFDKSEQKAWGSAPALYNLLVSLDQKYGVDHVNLIAHSMGNIVSSEALRIAATQSLPKKVVNSYIASQAAVPAEAFDPNPALRINPVTGKPVLNERARWRLDASIPPDIYFNFPPTSQAYFAKINLAAGSLYNFYNNNDYATNDPQAWPWNQTIKPDLSRAEVYRYGYDQAAGTSGAYVRMIVGGAQDKIFNLALQSDVYETFSFAAPPQSLALGATSVGGVFVQAGLPSNGQVNLNQFIQTQGVNKNPINFLGFKSDHSAQFQDSNTLRKYYWWQVLSSMGIKSISRGSEGME